MKALVLDRHYKNSEEIQFNLVEKEKPKREGMSSCLVKVAAVGVNPSDALATLGYFPRAKLPRIPGRDFAGTISEGPSDMIGVKVWGSGGAAGIRSNGSLCEYIELPCSAIAQIPYNLDLLSAGAQILPYITAYYSLVQRSRIRSGETVIIVGALGQVGRAAMSICSWKGCKGIALVKGKESVLRAEALGWTAYDTCDANFIDECLAEQGNADVILNSIGNLVWDQYIRSLNHFGRIVTIGAQPGRQEVILNLFERYRANQEIIGVNTVALGHEDNARILNELKLGFEMGILEPLSVNEAGIYPFNESHNAFQQVLTKHNNTRVVIEVNDE